MTVVEALELLATILGGVNNAIKIVKEAQANGSTVLSPLQAQAVHAALVEAHPAFSGVDFLKASTPGDAGG